MKKTTLIVLSIVALALAGCKDKPATEAQQPAAAPAGQMPPGHPSVSPGGPGAPGANNPHANMKAQEIPAGVGNKKAKVTQTIDSTTNPPYTYIEVSDEKGQKLWLALPQFKVKVGDTIEYPETSPMTNFTSKTLNRTFEKLAMVPGIRIVK